MVHLDRAQHLVALTKSLSVVNLCKGHALISHSSMVNPSRKFAAKAALLSQIAAIKVKAEVTKMMEQSPSWMEVFKPCNKQMRSMFHLPQIIMLSTMKWLCRHTIPTEELIRLVT